MSAGTGVTQCGPAPLRTCDAADSAGSQLQPHPKFKMQQFARSTALAVPSIVAWFSAATGPTCLPGVDRL
eukprot:365282-Chlamydomonas_euryale.AAC.6